MLFAVRLLISTLPYQRRRRQGSPPTGLRATELLQELEMFTVKTNSCKCLAFSVSLQGRFSE